MAELTLFAYRSGSSFLHLLDARIKLAAMAGISVASLTSGVTAMVPASLLVVGLLLQARISLLSLFFEIRYFLLLMVFIFVTRALSVPGDPIWITPFFSVSLQGLVSASMLCWRLGLIAIMGLSLTATTRPALIRQGIHWFLSPIPGVPHQKIGTMIGLLIRFVPVIFMLAHAIGDAQRARCIDQRKNPVYRMVRLSMSLLRNAFVTADRLALAMEARGYGSLRTPIPWRIRPRDWLALTVAFILCVLMVVG